MSQKIETEIRYFDTKICELYRCPLFDFNGFSGRYFCRLDFPHLKADKSKIVRECKEYTEVTYDEKK